MPNLILLVGQIGSGKSTLAKQFAKKGYIIISRDGLRSMIGGGEYKFNKKIEPFIKKCSIEILREAIEQQKNIVMDECNMNIELRLSILYCNFHHKTIIIEMPKLSKEESIKRRLQNPHGKYPKKTWEEVYDMFESIYEKPTKKEGYNKIIRLKQNYKFEKLWKEVTNAKNN